MFTGFVAITFPSTQPGRRTQGTTPPGCPLPSPASSLPSKASKFPCPQLKHHGGRNHSASPLLTMHGPEVGCRDLSPGRRWPRVQTHLGKGKPLPAAESWGAAGLGQASTLQPHGESPGPGSPPEEQSRGRSLPFFFFFFDKCLYLLPDRGLLHSSSGAAGRTALPLLSAGRGGWIGSGWCGPGCCTRCTS